MIQKPNIMMILAAGRGVRMQSLTNDKPKPLISVNKRTLLDRIIDHAVDFGINEFVVNTCYKADMIESTLKQRSNLSIHFSREESALETGGGTQQALPLLLPKGADGFFVSNADPLWQDQTTSIFEQLSQKWDPKEMDVLLALIPTQHAFGDVHDGNYFIENNRPRRQQAGEKNIPFLFTGIQIIHPRVFSGLSPTPRVFSLREIYDTAERKRRLSYIIYDGDWYHVGTPQALQDTETRLKDKK